MIHDADGQPIAINPSLVRSIEPAGEGNRDAFIVFDDTHRLYVKASIRAVVQALAIETD